MYWFNRFSSRLGACILFCTFFALTSCTQPNVKEAKSKYRYFDLKGFMRADSARIALINPTVYKTVNHNGEAETKQLKIANWGNELGLFTASDINKPSWRDSYRITSRGNTITYQAKTPGLKTQTLIIERVKGIVKAIHISNHTNNMLYQTSEELSYFPDAAYTINKQQHVLLLGSNRYIITGKFVK